MDRWSRRRSGVRPRVHRGRATSTAAVVTALILLLTAAGCPKATVPQARSALEGFEQLVQQGDTSLDDLLRQRRALEEIPTAQFSEADLTVRSRLLAQSDDLLADTVALDVDGMVRTQLGQLEAQAADIAETATIGTDDPTFVQDFTAVTKDVVVGAACDEILDVIAPDQTPDEPGEGSDWDDAAQEAYDKLLARWNGPTFVNLVDWAYYSQSVAEDGEQLAENLVADPTEYVQFASAPPVQRALVVYLRTCYSPPRGFRPVGLRAFSNCRVRIARLSLALPAMQRVQCG
jgi:hypothetical protein